MPLKKHKPLGGGMRREVSPAADAFLEELDHAIEAVSQTPLRWPLFKHGTRRYLYHRFPFQLIYRVASDRIEIVAVAHGRRRPGYWKTR
jgi:plasmid stabilization system protein ParE